MLDNVGERIAPIEIEMRKTGQTQHRHPDHRIPSQATMPSVVIELNGSEDGDHPSHLDVKDIWRDGRSFAWLHSNGTDRRQSHSVV